MFGLIKYIEDGAMKRIIFIVLLISLFPSFGCTNIDMPTEIPKDFGFKLNYGVLARNELNTFDGTVTKDLVGAGFATTKLMLTNQELQNIYVKMKEIDILSYPEDYHPQYSPTQQRFVTPFKTYALTMRFEGKTKKIFWADKSESIMPEAKQLRDLIEYIKKIIESKEEYKKLPPPEGAYL